MFKFRVGIIGAGAIAEKMATTVNKMMKADLYAIASRDQAKADKFAGLFGAEKAYGSYEEMLVDPKVDLVYIATPHTFHKEHAMLCIDYKKPVLVEKPFCVNYEEAKELIDYAEKKKVFLTEAIWTRYMPMREMIDQVLARKLIGEPKFLSANLSYEITNKERLRSMDLAGGALLDLGIYPLHFADMVFGNNIKSIQASCAFFDTGVDASDSITIYYEDGKTAVLTAAMNSVGDRKGIIQGTKGFMVIENINNPESYVVYNDQYEVIEKKKCPRQISGYEYEIEACRKAIKNKELECDEIPHETTLTIMKRLDEIRKQFPLKYPFE